MKLKILFIAISVLVFSNSYAENHIIPLKVEKLSQAEAEKIYQAEQKNYKQPFPSSHSNPIYSQSFKVNFEGNHYSFLPITDVPLKVDYSGCSLALYKENISEGSVNFECSDVTAMSFFLRKENKRLYVMVNIRKWVQEQKDDIPSTLLFTYPQKSSNLNLQLSNASGEISKAKTIAEGKKYFNLYFDKHPDRW